MKVLWRSRHSGILNRSWYDSNSDGKDIFHLGELELCVPSTTRIHPSIPFGNAMLIIVCRSQLLFTDIVVALCLLGATILRRKLERLLLLQ